MLHKMAYHTTLAEARESLKTSRMSDSAVVDITLKLARKRRLERSSPLYGDEIRPGQGVPAEGEDSARTHHHYSADLSPTSDVTGAFERYVTA